LATQQPQIQTRIEAKRRESFFYVGMAILAAAVVFAGFSRTYYLRNLFGHPPLKPLLHLHGLLFTSWILLLIVQVSLVASKRVNIHRRLGVAGGVLAAIMVIVGTTVAIHSARGEFSPGGPDPLAFLSVPLFDMLVFAILVGAALLYRRQPDIHKRLMLIATLALLPAAIARFPGSFFEHGGPPVFFGIADLILLACVVYDTITNRRLHPAYVWGGLLLVASHPLRILISATAAWHVFAHWLTGV
jgi:hypothetical protein